MAIEFSCPQCQHQLRTSEDKAGLSAKCPACGSPIWVPYAHEVGGPAPENVDPEIPAAGTDTDPFGGILSEPARPSGPVEEFTAQTNDEPVAAAGDVPLRRAARAQVRCPNCAAENDVGSPVCRFCGTSLEGVQPEAPREWRPPRFDISEIMSTAWRFYTQEIGLLIGCQLLFLLTVIVMEAAIGIPIFAAAVALQDDAAVVIIPLVIIAIPFIFVAIAAMFLGLTRLYLNVARGEPHGVGDLYYGFTSGRGFLGRALLVWLAMMALMLVGSLLCCLPGLLIMMCWWPAFPLLLDRDCSAGDALGQTYELIKQKFGEVLAVGAIAFAVQMVAGMVPYLGVILQLFAIPFAMLMTTVAYLRLTEQKTAFD